MEPIDRLAEKLRNADFDLAQLSEVERVETYALARRASIELHTPGADLTGGAITPLPARHP